MEVYPAVLTAVPIDLAVSVPWSLGLSQQPEDAWLMWLPQLIGGSTICGVTRASGGRSRLYRYAYKDHPESEPTA